MWSLISPSLLCSFSVTSLSAAFDTTRLPKHYPATFAINWSDVTASVHIPSWTYYSILMYLMQINLFIYKVTVFLHSQVHLATIFQFFSYSGHLLPVSTLFKSVVLNTWMLGLYFQLHHPFQFAVHDHQFEVGMACHLCGRSE
jgi:hypothetical protein